MITIKVSLPFSTASIVCQTPESKAIWNNCEFHINTELQECDYWIVYDDLLHAETVNCPKNNIILFTGEPPSIKIYDNRFLEQFFSIITCHTTMNHDNVINSQQALPWHVGKRLQDKKSVCFAHDYDELKKIKKFDKSKLVSIVISNKSGTEGHRKRLNFVQRLKDHFGDKLDIFNRDVNPVDDKWDAISRYKYHIAIENSSLKDYWTEKLSDSFLGGAYPFYYGCTNIERYFSNKALTKIDIDDIDSSISIIEHAINNSFYENSINEITKARELILDKYNFFPAVCDLINESSLLSEYSEVELFPQSKFINRYTLYQRLMKKFRGLLGGK